VRREQLRIAHEIKAAALDNNSNVGEITDEIITELAEINRQPETKKARCRKLSDFHLVKSTHESVLLGANRYANRGGLGFLTAPTGVGKSVMATQMMMCWAGGIDFMGIANPHHKPLKIAYVQAEDDDGDVAEMFHGVRHGMNLGQDLVSTIQQNITIMDVEGRGPRFVKNLSTQLRDMDAMDMLVVNPLMAYFKGNINDGDAVGEFFRENLNEIYRRREMFLWIIHHTAKPPKDKKNSSFIEERYNMHGSAELSNYGRLIISIRPRDNGEYIMDLAKRGKRAGVVEQSEENPMRWEPITEVPVKHSTCSYMHEGERYPVLCWEQGTPIEDDPEPTTKPRTRARRHTDDEILSCFPLQEEPENHEVVLRRLKELRGGVNKTQAEKYITAMLTENRVAYDEVNAVYYRIV